MAAIISIGDSLYFAGKSAGCDSESDSNRLVGQDSKKHIFMLGGTISSWISRF